MIASALHAKLACVDTRKLSGEFAGQDFDAAFLESLPKGVEPCGENGEFHSFVCTGPMLKSAIPVITGETLTQDGFRFVDLIATD
jgi:diphthamide synthase (EF-2-diphthine--ammonia ligase)